MKARLAAVKGMNDLLPPQIATWQHLERTLRAAFAAYGYAEIRTPIVEDTALFVRSVGEATDIVGKEMYTFEDRGQRSLTLRPEGTAPAARAYIEHAIANKEPLTRWFYLGPMFRYERMKTGRYRQFFQLGAEAYGAADAAQDAESIALAHECLRRLAIPDVVLRLNSLGDAETRPAYLEALRRFFAPHVGALSDDVRATFERNPMRLLDSKDPALQALAAEAPAIIDTIGDDAKKHFDEVQALLTTLGISYELDRRLVRGLDYYTRTTFEFVYAPTGENTLGTAGTVCGGGRYDRLVGELGGPEKPAVGFAMGLDRLVLLMEAGGQVPAAAGPILFVGTFDGPLRNDAVALVMKLRNAGLSVDFDPRGGKVGRQVERAAKVGATYFAAYGESEHAKGQLTLKNLKAPEGAADKVTEVAIAGLAEWLSAR